VYPGANGITVEGTLVIDGVMYGIQPAAEYFDIPRSAMRASNDATIDLVVSNLSDDHLEQIHTSCNAVLADPGTTVNGGTVRSLHPRAGGVRIIEVAAVGDYEWYQKNGSNASAAEGKIVSIINASDGHYRSELGFGIALKASKVFTTKNDPYSGTKPNAMLKQFSANKGGIDGDHAHLFTGRLLGGSQGGTIGVAWLDRTCSPTHNTGISQYLANGNVPALTALFMHELGHNAGSEHVKGSGVMHPSLNVSNPATTFSNSATKQIKNYLNSGSGSCVTGGNVGGDTYSVSGRMVMSGTDTGVSGASVSLSGHGSTQTNSSGNFSFSGVQSGSYTLSGSKAGLTISSESISVSGSNVTRDLEASEGGGEGAPIIKQHPKSISAPAGKKATLRVRAWISSSKKSSKGLQYQWFKDGTAIAGATKKILKLGALTPDAAGDYHVEVSCTGGSTDSNVATVEVKEVTASISVKIRPASMKKAKPAGTKLRAVCLAKITPASSRKALLANAQYEFRIGGAVVATQSGKKGKKYIHTLQADDNGKELSCTFIDSNGGRHDAAGGLGLKVE
jgi:hypothetical protein